MTDIGKIINSFNQYIVRPANAFGLGGFIFDIADETVVDLSAEITDHYAEDNSPIQDHVAVKPKRVTLSSYVGEQVYRLDKSTNTNLQKAVRKLTTIAGFIPSLSSGISQTKSFLSGEKSFSDFSLGQALSSATDLWSTVKNMTPPTQRQAQAYMYFKALHEQKILVSLQTPFEFMANMAIESVKAVQSSDSEYISEFTITIKEMRFAQTKTIPFEETKYKSASGGGIAGRQAVGGGPISQLGNRYGVQSSGVVNKGSVAGASITDEDIKALSRDPIFTKAYPKSSALPPPLDISTLPVVEVTPR